MRTSAQLGTARGLVVGLALVGTACTEAHPQSALDDAGHLHAALDGAAQSGAPDGGTVPPDAAGQAGDPARDTAPALAPDAAANAFAISMVGEELHVKVTGVGSWYVMTCSNAVTLEKQTASGSWGPPEDDRYPSWSNRGYYLDGSYVSPSGDEGCDQLSCEPLTESLFAGLAREYVQTGVRAVSAEMVADAGASYPGVENPARDVETRPLAGRVRVTLSLSRAPDCGAREQTALELDIPRDGVCCPVGPEGCSASGPGGGWARTLDECAPYRVTHDALSLHKKDFRGCDTLSQEPGYCCNCPRDAGL